MGAPAEKSAKQGCGRRAIRAVVGVAMAVALSVGGFEVAARDRNSWKNFDDDSRDMQRRQQAEIQQQLRQQAQDQRRAQREAEQAMREAQRQQRSAERDAAAAQRNDWGRQSWQQSAPQQSPPQQQQSWGQQKAQDLQQPRNFVPPAQAAVQETQGDDDAATRDDDSDDSADTDKPSKGKKPGRKASKGDDGVDDWKLTDMERRVREIERERQRDIANAQQQNDAIRRRELARTERIRAHEARKRQAEVENVSRLPPPPPSVAKPDQVKRLPVVQDKVATPEAGETSASLETPGRKNLLDGLPSRASHLGMNGSAAKGGTAEDKNARKDVDRADAKDARRDADASPLKRDRVEFPGKSEGAELPTKSYVEERANELVVTDDISPQDLEKAKANGFTVSEPVQLKGTGTTVRRLSSSSGVSRFETERELHKVLPFLPVTPNFAYTIFMGTLGETEGASALPGIDPRKVSPASPQPCPAKTCFGSQLINWTGNLRSCTKNVRIGVIDTSFDLAHPAFKGIKSVRGEFLNGEQPSPYDWHGTAVLSLLAGDPKSGTPGLVPDATYVLAVAFRSDVNGNASTDTVRLLAALDWMDQQDVDIVNMSFSGPKDAALAKAIERMSKKGVTFIAAAGNMGPTAPASYPAAYPHVVAVTAVNRKGINYKSANRGTYIDVAAPGVDILTALPKAQQGYRTGTSFAVPFITAIMAAKVGDARLVDAAYRPLEPDDISDIAMRDLGPPGPDPIYGKGLALAPRQCGHAGESVAEGQTPANPWSTHTTFIKAGAGLSP